MKRIGVLPFFSQQDKLTGQFILTTCASMQIAKFLAERMHKDLGWEPVLYLPPAERVRHYRENIFDLLDRCDLIVRNWDVPIGNLYQRLSFKPETWEILFGDLDALISMHEIINWPLKHVLPRLKLIGYYLLNPDEPWPWMQRFFYEGWRSIDAVRTLSLAQTERVKRAVGVEAQCWELGYDGEIIEATPDPPLRDLDIIFALRCSETNYTHHQEFIEALRWARESGYTGRVGFTDVTGYLRKNARLLAGVPNVEIFEEQESRVAYIVFLKRGMCVIAMNDNGHGGAAFREGIMCGAIPIAPRYAGYRLLLGDDWPHYVEPTVPGLITMFTMLKRSAEYGMSDVGNIRAVVARASAESYRAAWEGFIKADLAALVTR